LERESNAKTCASLVLRLGAESIRWKTTFEAGDPQRYPFAYLLDGFQARAEVLRSRIQPATAISPQHNPAPACVNSTRKLQTNFEALFEMKTTWGYSGCGLPAEPKPK
jgi:hypothetical protein